MDYTSTYQILQAIDRSFKPTTFFRDTFFPDTQTFYTPTVLMDYRKGTRKMAPFVSKNGGSVNVAREGFKTAEYEPPMISPARAMSIADISGRGFGENVISSITPEQRAQQLMARDISELIDMIVRREEWMCAQTLLKAGFTAAGYTDDGKEKIEDAVNFGEFKHKKTLSSTNEKWDSPSADIYGTITDMYKTVAIDSGSNPDILVTTQKTMGYIIKNDDVLKWLLRPADQMKLMTINPNGVQDDLSTNWGAITSLNNLQLVTYDGVYVDDDGQMQQYIPDGYVILAKRGLGSRLFGAVTQLEQDGKYYTYEGQYVPKVWSDIAGDSQKIRVASKCVPKPNDIDDWYVLKAY